MTTLRLLLGFSLVGLLALAPQRAQAQSTGAQAAAEALFREGRRLMEEGNYDEACPKFEASNRLDVAVGTLLNLGVCWEQAGRHASAWATFLEAAALAGRSGSPEREQLARSRALELEPRLIRIRVIVETPARGMTVNVGGRAFDDVMWSVAIPIDAGEWPVTATAPGRIPWEGTVTATEEGSVVELRVPPLELAPVVEVPQVPTTQVPVVPVEPETPPNPLRSAGWGVAALGVATLGAGIGLGVNAKNLWNGANCPERPDLGGGRFCASVADQADAENAATRANVATGLFVAGGTIAVTGVVLLILSRGNDDDEDDSGSARLRFTPNVGRQGASFSLQGSF
ncbi:MAG: tetratricopeptide repeat protein [Myxococcales bacterium]|nr:tetratricopeptide repeat protein [Myxococcales bacterium]MCB9629572.1 tetratricopeptide repeat protein [Sandaracinaceae bacterium]